MINDLDELPDEELQEYPTDLGIPELTEQEKAEQAERNRIVINRGLGHSLGIA
jgi:hypothetical protein